MAILNLGIAENKFPEEVKELSFAIKEITNDEPQRVSVVALAGPNDFVQILIDILTWQKALFGLALILGGKFASSFASELGKLAANDVWKEKKNYYDAIKNKIAIPIQRLVDAIKKLREKDQSVTIAIKIPGTMRNAGLVLSSDDPAVLIWQIANVIRCADKIQKILIEARQANPDSFRSEGSNPDMSIVIEVLENGDVKVLDIIIGD